MARTKERVRQDHTAAQARRHAPLKNGGRPHPSCVRIMSSQEVAERDEAQLARAHCGTDEDSAEDAQVHEPAPPPELHSGTSTYIASLLDAIEIIGICPRDAAQVIKLSARASGPGGCWIWSGRMRGGGGEA